MQAIDDDLPVLDLRTMDEQLEQQNWPYRVFGSLFAIFAAYLADCVVGRALAIGGA